MPPKKNIAVARVFYPMGHGAFYSETFEIDDKKAFTMVFDCGSLSLVSPQKTSKSTSSTATSKSFKFLDKRNKLYKLINADLDGNKVDLLFISHCDADHINGIKLLDPKIIVIPFVNDALKWILQLIDIISQGNTNSQVLVDPLAVFPNATVLEVREGEEGGNQNPEPRNLNNILDRMDNRDNNDNTTNPNSQTGTKLPSINSGTPLTVGGQIPFWEFIPWNPNLNSFLSQFLQEINNTTIDITKLKADVKNIAAGGNGLYLMKKIDELIKVYNLLKNKNNHSLQVYSGPVYEDAAYCNASNICTNRKCHRIYDWHWLKLGCIYSGDIVVDDLWLIPFLKALTPNRLNRVGTIQIPHHGSKHNFGWQYAEHFDQPLICVICVQENRRYKMPSPSLIAKLLKPHCDIAIVTENVSTMLVESGSFTL